MESGWLIFFVLAVMGGLIAFIGDKLGSKVGKKRISLFGMRPKHTSILVTIVTGIMIALITIGVMSAVSENVRVALFGMEKLRTKMNALTMEVAQKTNELDLGKRLLADKTLEYNRMTERVRATNEELAAAERQQEYMRAQLEVVNEAYRKAQADVDASAAEIKELEQVRSELQTNIEKLDEEAEHLRTGIVAMREGQVVFRVGQVLSSAVVEPGLSEEEARRVLANILNDTNGLLLQRFNIRQDLALVRVAPEVFERAAKEIAGRQEKSLVRVAAAGNLIYGEPAWVDFAIHDDALLYHEGETVLEARLDAYRELSGVELKVLRFLRDVNHEAQEKGVLPDPLTGNVGQLDGQQLFEVIRKIAETGENVTLRAVAKENIYTEGPVEIDIVVEKQD